MASLGASLAVWGAATTPLNVPATYFEAVSKLFNHYPVGKCHSHLHHKAPSTYNIQVTSLSIFALREGHQQIAFHEGITLHGQGVQGVVGVEFKLRNDGGVAVQRILPFRRPLRGFQRLTLGAIFGKVCLVVCKGGPTVKRKRKMK